MPPLPHPPSQLYSSELQLQHQPHSHGLSLGHSRPSPSPVLQQPHSSAQSQAPAEVLRLGHNPRPMRSRGAAVIAHDP